MTTNDDLSNTSPQRLLLILSYTHQYTEKNTLVLKISIDLRIMTRHTFLSFFSFSARCGDCRLLLLWKWEDRVGLLNILRSVAIQNERQFLEKRESPALNKAALLYGVMSACTVWPSEWQVGGGNAFAELGGGGKVLWLSCFTALGVKP